MRQVVNAGKGGPLLGHSSCMAVKCLDDEEESKPTGPRQQVERERRLRREIANSNERRRMQSINHGYQLLKSMLPNKDGGEKLSKAAVLQHAAEFMGQLIEENKQLMLQNSELTKTLNSKTRQAENSVSLKRRKRDTESSDEGISLVYQPMRNDSTDLMEELQRNVAELRVQLEQEKQNRALLERSYAYNLMAAHQAAAQQHCTPSPSYPSPPQTRHNSSDDLQVSVYEEHKTNKTINTQKSTVDISETSEPKPVVTTSSSDTERTTFGKASSVASQNLSIIVEAINHLEGDKHKLTATDLDSGVSHGESSDDTKSDCSRTETPQPPPAHQMAAMAAAYTHSHPSLYTTSTFNQTPVSLVYRPTFLSGLVNSVQKPGVIVSPRHTP